MGGGDEMGIGSWEWWMGVSGEMIGRGALTGWSGVKEKALRGKVYLL